MGTKTISAKRAIAVEVLLFLAYTCFSASWMVGSILTMDMTAEFGVHVVPSSVNNAISAAKILGNFVAAWILIKLGPKKTVALASLLTCAVIGGALSTTFAFFIVTRFLLGFGGAVLMICMTPYVVYCFEPRKQPAFIGLNNIGPNTGNLLALLSIAGVRSWLGSWRSVILFYGAFSAAVFLLWLIFGKGYPITPITEEEKAGNAAYTYRQGLRESFLYRYIFTCTGRLVMYTVMLYLFPLNPSFTVNAARISLMIALTGIPGTIIGILLAQRMKRDVILFRLSGFLQTLLFFIMILTGSAAVATVSAVLLGFVVFISTPALFTLPCRIPGATPRMVAVLFTLYWTAAYILQMIVYAFVVMLVNRVGWNIAMLFTAFYSLTFFFGSFTLPDFSKPEVIARFQEK